MESDGYPQPLEPATFPVYLGFYVLPGNRPVPVDTVRVDYFFATSSDGVEFNNWQLLANTDETTGLFVSHSELDPNTFYAYTYQYVFADGSKTVMSDEAFAGQPQLLITNTINMQQIAPDLLPAAGIQNNPDGTTGLNVQGQILQPGVYADITTGIVTVGTLLGTTITTGTATPKVQLDDSGLQALDGTGHQTFYLSANDGSLTLTGPIVTSADITGGTITATDITSSTIEGTTITGGSFVTSASDPRVIMTGFGNAFAITNGGGVNVIQIDPTDGILLTGGAGAINQVEWRLSGLTTLVGQMYANPVGNATQIFIGSLSSANNNVFGSLQIGADTGGNSTNFVVATASTAGGTGSSARTLIDGNGRSSFLQFGSGVNKASVAGTSNFTFSASGTSNTITINVPNATNTCTGVAIAVNQLINIVVNIASASAGSVSFVAQTNNSGSISASVGFSYICWEL